MIGTAVPRSRSAQSNAPIVRNITAVVGSRGDCDAKLSGNGAGPPHGDEDTSGSRRVSIDVAPVKAGDQRSRLPNWLNVWPKAPFRHTDPLRIASSGKDVPK
jgi:hypothetical protein